MVRMRASLSRSTASVCLRPLMSSITTMYWLGSRDSARTTLTVVATHTRLPSRRRIRISSVITSRSEPASGISKASKR